ncbi:MAG: hypothetical protein ACI9YR_001763, partial [Bacteroidia bacterium]
MGSETNIAKTSDHKKESYRLLNMFATLPQLVWLQWPKKLAGCDTRSLDS